MTLKKAFGLLVLGLGMAACSTAQVSTRDNGFEPAVERPAGLFGLLASKFVSKKPTVFGATTDHGLEFDEGKSPVTVNSLTVDVPKTLVVSEGNSYVPSGDIVWREDPFGDRHDQVRQIVQDAMNEGVKDLNGPLSVDVEIEVLRFHALTEKARYTTGGVHALSFNMTVKDSTTGEVIVPSRKVRADFEAFGGQDAIEAEAAGLTQKVRISEHLAMVISDELTSPNGYQRENPDLVRTANKK